MQQAPQDLLDRFLLQKQLTIPDSLDENPMFLKHGVAQGILPRAIAKAMPSAVQFHSKSGLSAVEVEIASLEGMLTSEFVPRKAPVTQQTPEFRLGRRHITPQLSCSSGWIHALPKNPLQLPGWTPLIRPAATFSPSNGEKKISHSAFSQRLGSWDGQMQESPSAASRFLGTWDREKKDAQSSLGWRLASRKGGKDDFQSVVACRPSPSDREPEDWQSAG